jgi:predicted nucleic acid-binding protein
MSPVFVDANIPMYLVGADHPNKDRAAALLETAIGDGERLVTDAEVLQEVLHRYTAIDRPEAIQPAFDALLGVVDKTYGIELADVQEAKRVILGGYGVSARDALHIAVMTHNDVGTIMSFDKGFDRYPGIRRID